jgi:hypothetical protein
MNTSRFAVALTSTFFAVMLSAGESQAQGDAKKPASALFANRDPAKREQLLREFGGTKESEEAVERGLNWLARQQKPDGRWMLNDPGIPVKDRGAESNDIAATAFGLLPFLAAGKTHKADAKNEYGKVVDKGLTFLIRSQDKKTGYFGGSMYAHGLAAIAMCEAYGMTQDPALKKSAQASLNLLIGVQHDAGGWRYSPSKQPGDMSISGWQMMALKTGRAAGLDVPKATTDRCVNFLDLHNNADTGYAYIANGGSTPTNTAIALVCRQHLQAWGPAEPKLKDPVQKFIKANPADRQDAYYYYYASQVMFNVGGQEWTDWNDKMRTFLVTKQDVNAKSPQLGSWSPQGDLWGRAGGRLMITSLNLLTLEIYYRHAPLFEPKDKKPAN